MINKLKRWIFKKYFWEGLRVEWGISPVTYHPWAIVWLFDVAISKIAKAEDGSDNIQITEIRTT